mmetsp:Transcript_58306/g.142558  ORF Transcript_58306/g.142558 Transcript_58306/m.142558 type:complete len:582 (-) Transcript_58306:329-2074(-)
MPSLLLRSRSNKMNDNDEHTQRPLRSDDEEDIGAVAAPCHAATPTSSTSRIDTTTAAAASSAATGFVDVDNILSTVSTTTESSATTTSMVCSGGRRRPNYDRTSTPMLDMIETATASIATPSGGEGQLPATNVFCGSVQDDDDEDDEDDDDFFLSDNDDDDEDDDDILEGMMDDISLNASGDCIHYNHQQQQELPPASSSSPDTVICSDESSEDDDEEDGSKDINKNTDDETTYDGDRLGKYHRQKQQSLVFNGDEEHDASFLSSPGGEGCDRHHRRRKKNRSDNDTDNTDQRLEVKGELDVEKYMASREMTPFQERMNAVTVMPGAFYCIMLLLSGSWLSQSLIEEETASIMTVSNVNNNIMGASAAAGADAGADDSQCLSWSWMPHLHALPPLPVLAAAVGIIFHAPFSFIYHWKYAHRLPPGLPRTTHWSRRMDQVMIHFCSMTMAYGTSGRFDFFVANALFNIDCIYRQFKKKVRPRRNQARIFISIVAYTIPIVRRGDLSLFVKIWTLFAISGWLFSKYPIGGWSHSVFHIVMAFVPPLLMEAGLELPASQPQLKVAAQCAVVAHSGLSADVNMAQ